METYKVLEPILLRATPSADGRYILDSNRLRKIANKEQIDSIKKRITKLNLNLHGGEARQNVDDIDSSIVGMDVYVDKKDKDLNNKTIDASAKSDSGNFKVVAYTEDYVVISDGKIAERGKHEDLILADGIYKRLSDIYNKTNIWQMDIEGSENE